MKPTLITVLTIIVAIAIAWWLVGFLLSFAFFIVKVLIVAVIAVLVYFALRGVFAGSRSGE